MKAATPTDTRPSEPPDPWGRPRDMYQDGYNEGCRHLRAWCAISAILGMFGGYVVLVIVEAVLV
jgi:hypothetical protein